MLHETVSVNGITIRKDYYHALELAAEGLSNKEIAHEMNYAEQHVHLVFSNLRTTSLFSLLGVNNRSEAIAWYLNNK